MACLASDTVFRIAKAKDMAPRNPTKSNISISYLYEQLLITCEKQHVLKIRWYFRFSP